MFTRKQVLKVVGLSSVLPFIPIDVAGLGSAIHAASAQDATVGEIYAGFLLLPDESPVPSTVTPAKFGVPIMCTQGGASVTAIVTYFDTHKDVQKRSQMQLYTFGNMPVNLQPAGGQVIEHEFGPIFGAETFFQSSQGSARLWAQSDFTRPFPMWSGPNSAGAAVQLDKVDFLLTPGLRVTAPLGYVFYWIARDVLYRLTIEKTIAATDAQALATSLTPLS